ncbi:Arrestin domain-containing protein 1 [Oryzias melastigma]|uniref:Arrestin domain-containing protein 1 n=1 Tax=Oryzias melastigma TaxID=30732 RepID=A0A834BY75_ORYME|nr:Arrestin domain-containing protein 1 [Oryzias melastigma]
MGKLVEFDIEFDKNKVVYSPGESISGTVRAKLSQAIQCKAIKVNCNGFCGITSKENDTAWTVEEQYFNSTVSVADKGTLKEGEHVFPFKFLISATAPTSFEGTYGRIIYRVRAFIETPRFSKDYTAEKPFYLLSLLNLNEIPDVWGINSSEVTQQFSYMLMKTGTIDLRAQTDMKGYTPNQVIQVKANVHNQSGKSTGNISASLVQRVTYEMKKPIHDIKTIAQVEGGTVKGGKEMEWTERIIIPPLPQSSLAGCELIKIDYYVKVSLKSPEVALTLPIHIGNVSLSKKQRSSKKQEAPPSSVDAADSKPSSSSSSPSLPSRPAPKPAPRPTPRSRMSSHSTPSAPPVDYHTGAEGGDLTSEDLNKRQSQVVLPNAFSYAPGLLFPHNQQPNGPAAVPQGTPGASLYPPLSTGGSVAAPFILPPDYGTSSYPQEAPPSYNESCNT